MGNALSYIRASCPDPDDMYAYVIRTFPCIQRLVQCLIGGFQAMTCYPCLVGSCHLLQEGYSHLQEALCYVEQSTIENLTWLDALVPPDEVMDYEALTCFKGYEIYEAVGLFTFTSRQEERSSSIIVKNERFVRRMVEIWVSPFEDRLLKFYSFDGVHMTFTDFIDLMSSFHFRCPRERKAEIVFRICDFDEDGLIGEEDIIELLERLSDYVLTQKQYKETAEIILEYGDVDGDGYLEINEFKRMLEKHPDFPDMFHLYFLEPRDLRSL